MAEDHVLADLVTPTAGGATQCLACQWGCVLRPGETGRCLVRTGVPGGLALLNYGLVSGASIGPVEDLRLWHFFPESRVMAVGGWGYAAVAEQEGGVYGAIPTDPARLRRLDADRVANVALERLCRGVVWAFGEPAVSHEYVRSLVRLSRAASRYTAMATSGALSLAALDELGHYLDGLRFELYGFSAASYAHLAGLPDWQATLAMVEHARQRWGCHIEVVTHIHPGLNDTPDELRAMGNWIGTALGPQTPWHILPADEQPATLAAADRAHAFGQTLGLAYVYGHAPDQPTCCNACGAILITRTNGNARVVGLKDEACANCGQAINVRRSIFKKREPPE